MRTLLTIAAFAAGVSAFGTGAHAQDCTTKIGATLPTSVDWGRPIAEVAQFAVDQVNEAGGAAGCQIEMVLRDTQVDPKVGVDAFTPIRCEPHFVAANFNHLTIRPKFISTNEQVSAEVSVFPFPGAGDVHAERFASDLTFFSDLQVYRKPLQVAFFNQLKK